MKKQRSRKHDRPSLLQRLQTRPPRSASELLNDTDEVRSHARKLPDSEISKVLLAASSDEEGMEHVDDALASYLRMLAGVDVERDSQEHQRNGLLPEVQPGGTRVGQADVVSPIGREEGERAASPPPDEVERERADPSRYAWAGTGAVRSALLSANLRATNELLRQYSVDIKRAKRDLLHTVGAPEFPASEWDNILRGFAVDLDRVLGALYSISNDDDEVTELGPFKVSAPRVRATRKVGDAGQWVYAWNQTVVATSFAFPHRLRELTEYGSHILGLFRVLAPQFHPRLLEYDCAVRRRVGLRRDLELTDVLEFADL